MGSKSCWRASRLACAAALFLPLCPAQSNVLSVSPPEKVTARRGAIVEVKTRVQLQSGYHVNSNTPSEAYLIPLRLTWDPEPLETVEVSFPKPHMEKYAFSEKPLSVFTGDFELTTKFRVSQTAPTGPNAAAGKLRYQACNYNSCLPPRTIEIKLPVVIQ